MLLLLEESWSRVQDVLRERCGAATYESWLVGLRPVMMEKGTVFFEADSKLCADRVRALFRQTLAEVLSKDFGTELKVEVQARAGDRFNELEVSPQQPVIDESNRTATLVLRSLLPRARREDLGGATASSVIDGQRNNRLVHASLYLLHGQAGVGKTFLLRWWRQLMPTRTMWFDLPVLLKAFQAKHRSDAEHARSRRKGRRGHVQQTFAGMSDLVPPADLADAKAGRRSGQADGQDGPAEPPDAVERLREELCADQPLVIDELHRIAGKPALQSFLAKVLRAREQLASPTILASRWHPKDVRDLDASLASQLLAGFVCAIDPPSPLGRLRYLRAIAGKPSRNGQATEVESLAQQFVGNYPELRAAWAQSRGRTLPPRYLELIDPSRVFQRLRDRVADHFGLSATDLVGKGQGRALSRARKVLALLCQQQGLSGGEIGRYLGRTRAAVSYMLLSLQRDLDKHLELRRDVEELQ